MKLSYKELRCFSLRGERPFEGIWAGAMSLGFVLVCVERDILKYQWGKTFEKVRARQWLLPRVMPPRKKRSVEAALSCDGGNFKMTSSMSHPLVKLPYLECKQDLWIYWVAHPTKVTDQLTLTTREIIPGGLDLIKWALKIKCITEIHTVGLEEERKQPRCEWLMEKA